MAVDQLSSTFAALADPTRRAILARLAEGEATVNELARPVPDQRPGGLPAPEGAGAGGADHPQSHGAAAALAAAGRAAEGSGRLARDVRPALASELRPPGRAAWLRTGSPSPASSTRRASASGESGPSRSASPTGSAARDWEAPLDTVSMDVRPGGAWRLSMFSETGRREIHWRVSTARSSSPNGSSSRSRRARR